MDRSSHLVLLLVLSITHCNMSHPRQTPLYLTRRYLWPQETLLQLFNNYSFVFIFKHLNIWNTVFLPQEYMAEMLIMKDESHTELSSSPVLLCGQSEAELSEHVMKNLLLRGAGLTSLFLFTREHEVVSQLVWSRRRLIFREFHLTNKIFTLVWIVVDKEFGVLSPCSTHGCGKSQLRAMWPGQQHCKKNTNPKQILLYPLWLEWYSRPESCF